MTIDDVDEMITLDLANDQVHMVWIEMSPQCMGSWEDIHHWVHPQCTEKGIPHPAHDIEGRPFAGIVSTPIKLKEK